MLIYENVSHNVDSGLFLGIRIAGLQFERQAALYEKGIVSKAVFDHAIYV